MAGPHEQERLLMHEFRWYRTEAEALAAAGFDD